MMTLIAAALSAPPATVPDPRLQQLLFSLPKPGPDGDPERLWLGADCATSVQLPHNRTLWLFGDTLVGKWKDYQRVLDGCVMPHQTVAIQQTPSSPLQIKWRKEAASKAPLQLFWPHGSPQKAISCDAPFGDTHPYYWVVSGIESGSTGLAPGKLLLLAQRVRGTPGQGLGFTVMGTSVIAVDNAEDAEPSQWRHRAADLTTCSNASTCEMWAAGIFAAPSCGPGCVYLVGGVGSAASGHGQAVMRGSLADLLALRFDTLQALGADGEWHVRVPGARGGPALRALFPQQPELSLQYAAFRGGRWLAASFDKFMGTRLLLWSSETDDVRGPWSATLAYTLPPPWNDTRRFYAYAAKLHPHLAGRAASSSSSSSFPHLQDDRHRRGVQDVDVADEEEVVITFVANAWNMTSLFSASESVIYTPQVLRVNLTRLFG